MIIYKVCKICSHNDNFCYEVFPFSLVDMIKNTTLRSGFKRKASSVKDLLTMSYLLESSAYRKAKRMNRHINLN